MLPLDIWSDIGGFFNTLMQPLYWAISAVLAAFHWFFSLFLDPDAGLTWALSIVLLTIVTRTLLIPLFVKQINSARNMQLLQPKIKALQEKYGSDREKLSQEQMKLFKEEGVNPMASCLPILLQSPVFIALFWVLRDVAFDQPVGWFTQDPVAMASLRDATLFGARVSATFWPVTSWGATQTLAGVMIVVMVTVLFITQLQLMRKNMPPEALTGPMAQQQKMMLYMFPLIYAFGGANVPIGVLIYWLTTNLWTMGQQYILIHNNPAPNTPAYIDWEERMRAKGKNPDEIAAKRRGAQKKGRAQQPPSDPTKVQRQNTGGTPAKPTTPGTPGTSGTSEQDGTDGTTEGPKKIQRQQIQRKSRAKRKGTGPGQAPGPQGPQEPTN